MVDGFRFSYAYEPSLGAQFAIHGRESISRFVDAGLKFSGSSEYLSPHLRELDM